MKGLGLTLLLPGLALAALDVGWIDVNNWHLPLYNDARWGIDITRTNYPGGYWPQPLLNFYVFGGGLWLGSIVQGETLVSVGYNPSSGANEFYPTLCRYWREGLNDPRDRVYRYPGDWPPSPTRFPMAPTEPRGDLNLWCAFGDSNPGRHTPPGHPLGIDVALSAYGYGDSLYRDIVILRYDLINGNDYSINRSYVALCLDADIGNAYDDMNGLILDKFFHHGPDTFRVSNTGFTYDFDNVEPNGSEGADRWEGGCPGAVAIRLLDAPDSLNASAFKTMIAESCPTTDGGQYSMMAGYDWQTGAYAPFDSIDSSPNEKKFLLSCGPFDILPHSTQVFYYALIGSPFGDSAERGPKHDSSELAWRCHLAEEVYQRVVGVVENHGQFVASPVLLEAFPNPFRDQVTFRLSPTAGRRPQELRIYDISGQLVREFSERQAAGSQRQAVISWDGTDARGRKLANGVYLARLEDGNGATVTKQILLLR